MPDWAEVDEALRRQAAARAPDPAALDRHRAMQQTVSLRMERLVALDEWDTFKAHVEQLIALEDAALAGVREAMETGSLVGESLAKASLASVGARRAIEAYRLVLSLPGVLRDRAELEAFLAENAGQQPTPENLARWRSNRPPIPLVAV